MTNEKHVWSFGFVIVLPNAALGRFWHINCSKNKNCLRVLAYAKNCRCNCNVLPNRFQTFKSQSPNKTR